MNQTPMDEKVYVYCSGCKFKSVDNDWYYSNAILKRSIYGEYYQPVKCKAKNSNNDCKEYQPSVLKRFFNLFYRKEIERN